MLLIGGGLCLSDPTLNGKNLQRYLPLFVEALTRRTSTTMAKRAGHARIGGG